MDYLPECLLTLVSAPPPAAKSLRPNPGDVSVAAANITTERDTSEVLKSDISVQGEDSRCPQVAKLELQRQERECAALLLTVLVAAEKAIVREFLTTHETTWEEFADTAASYALAEAMEPESSVPLHALYLRFSRYAKQNNGDSKAESAWLSLQREFLAFTSRRGIDLAAMKWIRDLREQLNDATHRAIQESVSSLLAQLATHVKDESLRLACEDAMRLYATPCGPAPVK